MRTLVREQPIVFRVPAWTLPQLAERRRDEFRRLTEYASPLLFLMFVSIFAFGIFVFHEDIVGDTARVLWPANTLTLAFVLTGVAGVRFARILEHHVAWVSLHSALLLAIQLYTSIVLTHEGLSSYMTHVCSLTVFVVVLALKLTVLASALACTIAFVLGVGLALLHGGTPDLPQIALYFVGASWVSLSVATLLERQSTLNSLQSMLLEHDAHELERLAKALDRIAHEDALTGLANRRHFDLAFTNEHERHARDQLPLAVLMLDIDFFKQFNDTYGHAAGDECLSAIGRALMTSVNRPGDFVARYGGEEFVAVLANTSYEGAKVVAERIVLAVEQSAIPHERSSVAGHVTISIGVAAATPSPASNAQHLLEQADQALYEAKRRGRRGIVAFDELEAAQTSSSDSTIAPKGVG